MGCPTSSLLAGLQESSLSGVQSQIMIRLGQQTILVLVKDGVSEVNKSRLTEVSCVCLSKNWI